MLCICFLVLQAVAFTRSFLTNSRYTLYFASNNST